MNFLKNLFATNSDSGNYYYVRPKHCKEIIKVRVNVLNESSLTDDGGYFARKIVRGSRCPFPAELHLYLDGRHKLQKVEVVDGEQVSKDEYEAWLSEKASHSSK